MKHLQIISILMVHFHKSIHLYTIILLFLIIHLCRIWQNSKIHIYQLACINCTLLNIINYYIIIITDIKSTKLLFCKSKAIQWCSRNMLLDHQSSSLEGLSVRRSFPSVPPAMEETVQPTEIQAASNEWHCWDLPNCSGYWTLPLGSASRAQLP